MIFFVRFPLLRINLFNNTGIERAELRSTFRKFAAGKLLRTARKINSRREITCSPPACSFCLATKTAGSGRKKADGKTLPYGWNSVGIS